MTNNLFPPTPDLLLVTAVASVASTSTATSGPASLAVETRDGNGKYLHCQKRQEAPFPIKPGYRLIFHKGGNALEGVRVRKQLGLFAPADDVASSYPEPIGPDGRDPAHNARPEERRSLGRECDRHVHYLGVNRCRDLYYRNRLPPKDLRENSNRVGHRAVAETKYEYPMLRSSNRMSPQLARILSGEGEGLSRRSPLIPPHLEEGRFRSLIPLDGEYVSEDVDTPRVRKREGRGGHNSDTGSRNEYPLFTSDNIFGPAAGDSTRPITTGSESETSGGSSRKGWVHENRLRYLYPTFVTNNQFRSALAGHKCLRENTPSLPIGFEVRGEEILPTFGSPRARDPSFMPLLSRDGEDCVVDAAGLVKGVEGADIRPLGLITILEEASSLSGRLRPAEPVTTHDDFEAEAAGSSDSHNVLEASDDWEVESVGSFRPFELGEGGGPRPGELERSHSKKLGTLGEAAEPLARRSHSLDGRSQVSFDPNPGAIYVTELGDDSEMSSRTVRRRLNKRVRNYAGFEPTLPDSSLGAVGPAGKDEGTPQPLAGARSGGNRVSINSPLMAEQNGRVYHEITRARSEDGAHVFNLPRPVPPIGIRPISMNEIDQLLSKDLDNRESSCLLDMGGRTTSGSPPVPTGCVVRGGVDGKPHPRNLKRSIDGSDYVLPFVGGNPIQLAPGIAQAMNENGEAPVGIVEGAGTSDMTLLFHSLTLDKLAVVLPVVMFGTLLLVLFIFGMTFCCLRQAEETYHINVKMVENRNRRNRDSRRRRKNNASTGAAEEGDIAVPPPEASAGQSETGNINRGWFLQRWYNSLRGDATPKTVSYSNAKVISQRNPKPNLGWARGLDGGQDARDTSYVLDAVSDRLQQTQGRPRSLSTIWSDGGLGSSAIAKAVLAAGRKCSEDPILDTTMMSRRMHGARGGIGTDFPQESISTTGAAGLSGNPSGDLTLTHSQVETFTDTSGPSRQEALKSKDTLRMVVGRDLRILDNPREPKGFVRVVSPDLYASGSGTEDTPESSEAGKGSWIEGNRAVLRRCEGDTRGREDESGPSGTVENGEILGRHA